MVNWTKQLSPPPHTQWEWWDGTGHSPVTTHRQVVAIVWSTHTYAHTHTYMHAHWHTVRSARWLYTAASILTQHQQTDRQRQTAVEAEEVDNWLHPRHIFFITRMIHLILLLIIRLLVKSILRSNKNGVAHAKRHYFSIGSFVHDQCACDTLSFFFFI